MVNPNTYNFSLAWPDGVNGVQSAAVTLGGFKVQRSSSAYLSYEARLTLAGTGYVISLTPMMADGSGAAIEIMQFQVIAIS